MTIGACATAGGIQALRNFADVEEFLAIVYAQPRVHRNPGRLDADRGARTGRFRAARLSDQQDSAARGDQRVPARTRCRAFAAHSVCVECKRAGNVCVMVAHGTPCLGPVTQAGCGALCPSYDRGCYGCFGPMESPNTGHRSQALVRARHRATATSSGCSARSMPPRPSSKRSDDRHGRE